MSTEQEGIYSERQYHLFEDALRQICDEARSMDEGLYNGSPLIDNLRIARGFECLIGSATEEPISLPCDLCGEDEKCEHDGMNRK